MAIKTVCRQTAVGLLGQVAHPVHIQSQLLVAQTLANRQLVLAVKFPCLQIFTQISGDRERILCLQFLFITLKFHVSLSLKGQMRRTPLPT